ncbi:MAG: very short patch repair endonuclease [Nitrosopumilaceae archaeon]
MVDVFTPEKRSMIMSKIRSKNTKIDRDMRELLSKIGCEYIMYPKMYGNPDFIIPSMRIAIFCDGDFWHGFKYHEKKKPSKKFWRNKIEKNMTRDKKVSRKLRSEGWHVLRFWEHDIEKRLVFCSQKISRVIISN